MREIKFRAWDKERKIMTEVKEIFFDNEFVRLEFWESDVSCYEHKYFDEIEIMQYTGLKDKNGVEIYEGDILKYKDPYDKRFKHISPVEYLKTQASFGILDIYGNTIPLHKLTANNYLQVVGNIYENKDLLEVKEWKIKKY